MKKFITPTLVILASFFISNPLLASAAEVPHAPTTEISSTSIEASSGVPLYLYIPSIKVFSSVQGVGIDRKGNMDTPSGRTNNVGWYAYGTAPGNVGTAVLDAHNTAAFKNLKSVPLGGDIYVFTSAGKWLHFQVTKANTYPAKTTPPTVLFAQAPFPQINLITCAGTLLGNGEATHRLIVSAQMV